MWRRGVVSEVPAGFKLDQNYPNPFNPTTRIRYAVANRERVTLKIFNVLGEEVATLVNADLLPGSYETTFDASGLASGMYVYRLQTQTTAITQKMMLLEVTRESMRVSTKGAERAPFAVFSVTIPSHKPNDAVIWRAVALRIFCCEHTGTTHCYRGVDGGRFCNEVPGCRRAGSRGRHGGEIAHDA